MMRMGSLSQAIHRGASGSQLPLPLGSAVFSEAYQRRMLSPSTSSHNSHWYGHHCLDSSISTFEVFVVVEEHMFQCCYFDTNRVSRVLPRAPALC